MIDQVSGNPVPTGSLPSEVRDDVNINVSEGEYIIPANVVRFIGLDRLEKMVSKAKEELGALEESGRIGGDSPPSEDDIAFSDDDVVMDDMPEEGGNFAEGGMVEGGNAPMFSQQNGYTGVKPYKDASGRTMYIPFVAGKPLYDPPKGYSETTQNQAQVVNPVLGSEGNEEQPNTSSQPAQQNYMKADPSPEFGDKALAGDPNKWTPDNFMKYGEQRGGAVENAVKGMATFVPAARLGMKAREKYLDSTTAKLFDQMLETGKDLQGNPLSEDQIQGLTSTKEDLKASMSKKSGLDLTPFGSLTEAVGKFSDFLGNVPRVVGNAVTGNISGVTRPSYSSKLTDAGTIPSAPSPTPSNPPQSIRGSDVNSGGGLNEKTYNDAKRTSGGLYSKGGLVKRRKT